MLSSGRVARLLCWIVLCLLVIAIYTGFVGNRETILDVTGLKDPMVLEVEVIKGQEVALTTTGLSGVLMVPGAKHEVLAGNDAAVLLDKPFNKFPNFASPAELKQMPVWHDYLLSVYGASVEDSTFYPVDVGNFHVLYSAQAPALLPALSSISVNTHLGERLGDEEQYVTPCPAHRWQVYRCFNWCKKSGCLLDLPSWVYVHQGKPPRMGWPNNTWVEVSHCSLKEESTWGMWFYIVRGSGIWLNLGRTAVFKDHMNAVQEVLKMNPKRVCKHIYHCERHFGALAEAAKGLGLDTLQFTRHDQRCGNTAVEFMWLSGVQGNDTCTGSSWSKQFLRAGLNASCACKCHELDDVLLDQSSSCIQCVPECHHKK